jgi:hypothetical protein
MSEILDIAPQEPTGPEGLPPVQGKTPDEAARNMRKDPVMNKSMQNNPMLGFFYMIFRLLQAFGGDKLISSIEGNGFLNSFISNTFNIDKPKNLISGLTGKAPVVGTVEVGERQVAVNIDKPKNLISGLTGKAPVVGTVEVGERQVAVNNVLSDAANSAGVSPELVRGIWGIETRFSSHKTMVSPSGCSGPFQFTKGTFNDVFKDKEFRDKILAEQGDKLEPGVKKALQEGNWKVGSEWGSDLRFHPVVSTYAAAEYMKDVGKMVGADPNNKNDFGKIYAGYNVGPGNAQKLASLEARGSQANAGSVLGSAASWNPAFFTGGASASEALGRYQAYVESSIDSYNKSFGVKTPAATQVASAEAKAPDGSLRSEFKTANAATTPLEKPVEPPAINSSSLKSTFSAKADPPLQPAPAPAPEQQPLPEQRIVQSPALPPAMA